MTLRIEASNTINQELRCSGYGDLIGDQIPWGMINQIDYNLEEIIKGKKNYDKQELANQMKYVVSKGVSKKLEDKYVDRMTGFVINKLERYISSGFTQSYDAIEGLNYFSYCADQFEPSREFVDIVGQALEHLKLKAEKTTDFDDLIINFGVNHIISNEIANYAKKKILQDTSIKKEIKIGGQIKLHPPRITDKDSINWHFDGDPRFIKVLCYLENQPSADGSFSIRSNYENGKYVGSHIKTIIQSINLKEAMKMMPGTRIKDMGIFMLNSHMPMLHRRYIEEQRMMSREYNIYPPSKFKVVMFKGVECLHRGGNNRQFYRPVFQGIASSVA